MKKEETIRVAHIIGKMCAGGVETVVFNYYREIDKNSVQFDFYYHEDSTVEPDQSLIDMGERFIKIPSYKHPIKYITTLIRYFKKEQYHIVHSHMNTLSVFPLFAAAVAGCNIRIAHNHSVPGTDNIIRNLMKYTLKLFSKCFATDYFACSEKAGRWLFGDREFETGNVRIIRNALDFDKFKKTQEEKSFLLNELGVENNFVIGHVGRFTFAKNHNFLLEIFKYISERRKDAVLVLVGDGELKQQILDKAMKLGIEDKVVLVGSTPYPERYYPLMNVVVLPSYFEGLSMTTIEAQVSGVPILVSEAVPEETRISSGWKKLSIDEGAEVWGDEALNIAINDVVLSEECKLYDITKEAVALKDWYINRRR